MQIEYSKVALISKIEPKDDFLIKENKQEKFITIEHEITKASAKKYKRKE